VDIQRKKQKTYSLPREVADWLHAFLEDNQKALSLLGITSETKLLEVLAKNGEPTLKDLLDTVQEKRRDRLTQPQ